VGSFSCPPTLAEVVGGKPAFSHPEGQQIREHFDGTHYYLETRRGRPEWVLDLTQLGFPPLSEIAAFTAQMIDAPRSQVVFGQSAFRMPAEDLGEMRAWLEGGFALHPIVGAAWRSAVWIEGSAIPSPQQVSAMTWELFNDPQANLLGSWTCDGGNVLFVQWNTMSEVRYQEQLGSYRGKDASVLWGFTSTLNHALGAMVRGGALTNSGAGLPEGVDEKGAYVIDAIVEQARPAVQLSLSGIEQEQDRTDRRLLWLGRDEIVGLAVWFNPIGPTILTIEVCSLPDGSRYLVYFQRHPSAPRYRVVAELEPDQESTQIASAITELVDEGSLPNVLALWNKPDVTASEVPPLLRERVLQVAEANGKDLIADAAWIAETVGRPWDFVDRDTTARDRVRAAAREKAPAGKDAAFDTWWEQVSSRDNAVENFRCLPDAWDGSLNFLRSAGTRLSQFDRCGGCDS